jgi:hypothetical protein
MHDRTRANQAILGGAASPFAAAAALLLSACQTEPTCFAPRPIGAPFRSAESIADQFLSPAAVVRDLGEIRERATHMVKDEADLGGAGETAHTMAKLESERVRDMAVEAISLMQREQERLGSLPGSKGLAALDPTRDLLRLRDDIYALPHTLQLDRRPLGEPDDLPSRTSPWDNHPEAGWTSRILRRILP